MESRWYLVNAKTGREEFAAVNLRRQDYETFLPMTSRTTRHARKVRVAAAAYFPGYLFVNMDIDRQPWRPINGTMGVLRLVTAQERPAAVPAGLVESLLQVTDADGFLNLACSAKPGDSVRIIKGPFAEQIGVIQTLSGADRSRVLLSIMNTRLAVEMPASTYVLA